jgi:tRNA 2-selenouridine synthase
MAGAGIELCVPTATVEQVLAAGEAVVVDLRSPSEFAADHVPGARNVPLFDDTQRALVGTLYKRASPAAAFEEGRRLVRAGVQELVAGIARAAGWEVRAGDLAARVERMTRPGLERLTEQLATEPCDALPARPVVLHCWRGGLRSRSVVALVRGLGLGRAVGLEGGYKSWRAHVLRTAERWAPPPAFVLRGLTGVGKTLVLRALEGLYPRWTLDLEGLAGHRSSLLGMVGLAPCSQRLFESRVAERLARGFPGPVVFEGESRKVGDVTIPRGVWEPLRAGTDIELTASVERRVDVLVADYLASDASRAELRARLPSVEARMKRRVPAGTLVGLLDGGRERELVERLLAGYYDPLYRRSEERHRHGRAGYAFTLDASDPARAAAQVAGWIEERLGRGPGAGALRH